MHTRIFTLHLDWESIELRTPYNPSPEPIEHLEDGSPSFISGQQLGCSCRTEEYISLYGKTE
jgi:hypothetical protein